jgi:serine/threonine protein kinase
MHPTPWTVQVSLSSTLLGRFPLTQGTHLIDRHPDASISIPNLPPEAAPITFHIEDDFLTFAPSPKACPQLANGTDLAPHARIPLPQIISIGPVELNFTSHQNPTNQSAHIAITIPASRPLSESTPPRPLQPSALSDVAITIPAGKPLPPRSVAESAANAPTIVPTGHSRGFVPLTPSPKRSAEQQTLTADHEYRIEKEIARGGMGVIYEGSDHTLQRSVAVKVSSLAGHNGDPRFKQEAEVLAALAHPNIVPIHSFGTDSNGNPFYSMKLIKGRTLQAIIDSLRTDPAKASAEYPLTKRLSIFRKACDALSFAHNQGFIHRDIKPDNIMVGEYGEVLVMDWGLAKRIGAAELPSGNSNPSAPRDASSSSLGMTLEGDVIGTPQYMAPEQAEGRIADIDERSDLYSLGGILFALLTLRPPIEGTSVNEVLGNVKSGRISSLTTRKSKATTTQHTKLRPLDHTIPEALRAITLKALAFRPEERYASVQALASDVDAFQNGFATQAEQAGFFRRTALLIKRHKAISALLCLLLVGGVTFTLRLAASERHAIAEHAQALRASANATIALAEVAEERLEGERMQDLLETIPKNLRSQPWNYLWNRLHPFTLSVESASSARWVFVQPHPAKPNVFLALQSHGLLSEIDAESGTTASVFDWKANIKSALAVATNKDGHLFALAKTSTKSGGPSTDIIIVAASNPDPKKPISQFTVPFTVGPFSGSRFGMLLSRDGKHLILSSSQKLRETNTYSIQSHDVATGNIEWSTPSENSSFIDITPNGTLLALTEKEGIRKLDPESGSPSTLLEQAPFPQTVANRILITADLDWERILTLKGTNIVRSVALKDGSSLLALPIGSEASQLQSLAVDRRGHLWTARRLSRQSSALESWDREGKPEMGYPLLSGKQGSWQITPHTLSDHLCLTKDSDLHIVRLGVTPKMQQATQRHPVHLSAFIQNPENKQSAFINSRDKQLFFRIENPDSTTPQAELPLPDLSAEAARKTALLANQNSTVFTLIQDAQQRPKCTVIRYQLRDGVPSEERRETRDFPAWWGKALVTDATGKYAWTGQSVLNLETLELESELQPGNLRFEGDSPERIAGIATWTGPSQVVQVMSVFETDDPEDDGWHDVLAAIEIPSGRIRKIESAPSAASLSSSPDGRWIAEAGFDRRVRIRSADTLEVEREFLVHEGRVRRVIWHPTRPALFTQGDDRRIKIIHPETGAVIEEMWSAKPISGNIKLSTDGSRIFLTVPPTTLTWEPTIFMP